MSHFLDAANKLRDAFSGTSEQLFSPEQAEAVAHAVYALESAEIQLQHLLGFQKGAEAMLDRAMWRLTSVTMCLWPGPMTVNGQMMDGTDAMKIRSHDLARTAATRPYPEPPTALKGL